MKTYVPLALACFSAGTAAQATVLVNVVNNGGTWTYEYTVDNSAPGAPFPIWAWSLDLNILPDWNQDDTAIGGDVAVPTDWMAAVGTPVAGVAAQDFASLDPAADVAMGRTLGVFSFTSAYPPGPVAYYEFDAGGAPAVSGSITGPIPEPSSVALVAGLGLVLWAAARRRQIA